MRFLRANFGAAVLTVEGNPVEGIPEEGAAVDGIKVEGLNGVTTHKSLAYSYSTPTAVSSVVVFFLVEPNRCDRI